jgi:hypothetical protein
MGESQGTMNIIMRVFRVYGGKTSSETKAIYFLLISMAVFREVDPNHLINKLGMML